MKKLFAVLITLGLISANIYAQEWKPDVNDKLELSVAQAIIKANESDPTLTLWFESAYAYAVYQELEKAVLLSGARVARVWLFLAQPLLVKPLCHR